MINHFGKLTVSVRFNTHLSCDSAIPLPDIYSRERKTYVPRKICIRMIITASIIIAPSWKQPYVH